MFSTASEPTPEPEAATGDGRRTPRWIWVVLGVLIASGFAVYSYLDSGVGPPPADIASDPFLVDGRAIYLARCASCHGPDGRGDGPLSKSLTGPRPRDFVADEWKYGTRPEQVLGVVTNGVPGTSMGAWKSVYSPEELRSVTAYAYHLAKKPVPAALRER